MKNLFIDGGNLLHRCYYIAKGRPIFATDGKEVGHLYHFLNNVKKLQDMFNCDNVFIAWDIRDKSFVNYRHEAVEYKENRNRDAQVDVHKWDAIIWSMCELLGVVNLKADKLEADDIISWLCSKHNHDTNIIASSDKDFIQLFNHYDNIQIYSPVKREVIDRNNLMEHTDGIDIDMFLLYRSIVGDSSDNIKGVYKYGPVKTKKLLLENNGDITTLSDEQKVIIERNLKVMDLNYGLSLYPDECLFYESQLTAPKYNISGFFNVIRSIGIHDILRYKSDWVDTFSKTDIADQLQKYLNSINN